MKMRDLHIERKKDKIRIEYIASDVSQEELERLATVLYTGDLSKATDRYMTEEDVLAIVNGWLDGERYACDLTQEE